MFDKRQKLLRSKKINYSKFSKFSLRQKNVYQNVKS